MNSKVKTILKNMGKTIDTDMLLKKTNSGKNALSKTLNAYDLIILGISAIIGSGIFVMIGPAVCGNHAHVGAGPATIISIILAAIACIFPALCYAEFASMIPVAGSAYTYTYATMGEFAAWMMGWVLMLEYAIGNITIAVSWTEYLMQLLKGFPFLPHWLTNPPIWLVKDFTTAIAECKNAGIDPHSVIPYFCGIPVCMNLPALFIVLLIGFVLLQGTKESAKTAMIMVFIKLAVILLFVVVGAFYIKPENWTPFMPFGFKGIILSAFIIFYAYIGFDAISTAAEETENPQKNLPIGLIGSLIVCSIIYAFVAVVFTGIIPVSDYGKVDILAPIAHVIRLIHQPWIAGWIALGALAALTSVLLVFQYGTTRILYAMTRDNFFPQSMKKIHPVHRTPHVITWVTTLTVMAGALFTDANVAAELCIFGTFASFILVCLGILILRKTEPDRPRPFKVPFCPWFPIAGILICLYLMVAVIEDLKTSALLFPLWLGIGVVIYFVYGYKQNRKAERGELELVEEDEAAAEISDVF